MGDRRCGLDFGVSTFDLRLSTFDLRLSTFDERMDALRTCDDAAAAAGAEIIVEKQDGRRGKAFGVVAPDAAQRTALYEDRRARTGTVVEREAADVRDVDFHAPRPSASWISQS